jgi:hypothetical protein
MLRPLAWLASTVDGFVRGLPANPGMVVGTSGRTRPTPETLLPENENAEE